MKHKFIQNLLLLSLLSFFNTPLLGQATLEPIRQFGLLFSTSAKEAPETVETMTNLFETSTVPVYNFLPGLEGHSTALILISRWKIGFPYRLVFNEKENFEMLLSKDSSITKILVRMKLVEKENSPQENEVRPLIFHITKNKLKIAAITLFADEDEDGVQDAEDLCLGSQGAKITFGCPDSDGDGVYDNVDKCPKKPGKLETLGCPDSDGDNIPNGKDKCPTIYGEKTYCGCPEDTISRRLSFKNKVSAFDRYTVSALTYHKGLVHAGSTEGTGAILRQLPNELEKLPAKRKNPFRFYGFKNDIYTIRVKDNRGYVRTKKGTGHYTLSSEAMELANKENDTLIMLHHKVGLHPLILHSQDTLVSFNADKLIIHQDTCLLAPLAFPVKAVHTLQYLEKKQLLVVFYQDNSIVIYKKNKHLLAWKQISTRAIKRDKPISAVSISTDGNFLYTGHEEGFITTYSLTSLK